VQKKLLVLQDGGLQAKADDARGRSSNYASLDGPRPPRTSQAPLRGGAPRRPPVCSAEKQKRIPLLLHLKTLPTKTAKRTHAFLDMGAFACILYDVLTQEIHRQNLKRHRFSRHVLDNL